MQPQRRHYFAHIPIIALLILLGLAPWLSVILFIIRAIDRDSEKKELQAARDRQDYSADFRPQDTRRAAPQGAVVMISPPPNSRNPSFTSSA